jgi:hypothetical protein
MQGAPIIRQVACHGQDVDLLSRNLKLDIREQGVYQITGSEGVDEEWRFEYLVLDKYSRKGALMTGEKVRQRTID